MTASINQDQVGDLVLIGLGANLPSTLGPPRKTCAAALDVLGEFHVNVRRRSRWYESAAVPPSDQPWFVNGVAAVETTLDPAALLATLLEVEGRFGRERDDRWAARTLDLDLLDYRGQLRDGPLPPTLPHPRLEQRAFVLLPLAEVAPHWRHPRSGRTIDALIAALGPGQTARPVA